jgi:type VI secretion system protein ImpJ
MAQYNKIIWREGMFLVPHHFQQWDLYHESLLNFKYRSSMPYYWGLTDLKIDREALENGAFTLLSCRGIFPGGTTIDIPDTDNVPSIRAIEKYFTPSVETLNMYLTVPEYRPGLANCQIKNDGRSIESRYSLDFIRVADGNTGNNEQEIPVAKKNLKFLFSDESLDGHDYLKIAELRLAHNGDIILRDGYIPPCISISASQELMEFIRRMTQTLTARSNDFRRQCRERGDGFYEFGTSELTNFWLFQMINSTISELNHFYNTEKGHPEDLFLLLTRFAGMLTVFSARIRPVDLPKYDHDNLSNTFTGLSEIIQELLRVMEPTADRCKQIPLKKIQESVEGSIYEAVMESGLVDSSYRFYLAVKGNLDQEDMIDEAERRMKIASSEKVSFIIGQAVRGIRLSFLRNPPTDIRTKAGYLYFALDYQSDYWEEVWESKRLSIYVPPSSKDVELELMACKE